MMNEDEKDWERKKRRGERRKRREGREDWEKRRV